MSHLCFEAEASETGERGAEDIVKMLLERGANITQKGKDELTPLDWAAIQGRVEAVVALVGGGADLNNTSGDGATPLMRAARNGHSGMVRRMLDLGADDNVVGTGGTYKGKTALDVAQGRAAETIRVAQDMRE